jgi:hypothetical protein
MPIATRRIMQSKPKLDLGTFYAPLYSPDMVAKGGSIASGTGTMAVTPLNLAVGANTVTATGAGTFIVTMPEGGTVASAAATITGSPVTIPAGIPTSVTTGVTTGTFTCTVSNIIRSKDKNNFALTITGAVWGYQGRAFAGGDDWINLDNVLPSLAATTVGAWEVWFKTPDATPAADLALITFGDTDAREYMSLRVDTAGKIYADLTDAGTGQWAFTSDGAIADDTWYHVALVQNATAPVLYINGALAAITFSVSTNKTRWFSVCTGLDNGWLGKLSMNGSPDQIPFAGTIGEINLNIRDLSIGELMHNFQTTKWRYQ